MWKNYLVIALRTLRRQKGYAAINIVGLAVGMTCCLLIFLLVRHEWSFDTFHAKAERIQRVLIEETGPDGSLDYHNLMPPPLAPEMEATFPGIETLTRVVKGTLGVRSGDQLVAENVVMVDSTFFDVLTFPLLAGDAATALDDPQSVVLTEPVAQSLFDVGSAYAAAVGRTLTVERGDDRYDFTVTGVMAPIPATSSLQFDLLLPFRQYETIRIGSNDWGGRTSLYLLLAEGQSAAALEAALPPFTEVQFAERIADRREAGYLAEGDAFRLVLQPLRGVHLTPTMPVNYEETPHNPLYSYILVGIALLVLGIACINFVILSVGRSTSRAREVGVRKTLGAFRGQLVRQFWGEALLMSVAALLLGVGLAALALPTFNTLTGQTLSLGSLDDVRGLLILAALVGVVALLAGSYPALVLSSFQPARVLKGEAQGRGPSSFTRGLVVLQYTLSIALIICTLVIYQQLDYLLNRDLGFRGDQVVVVATPGLNEAQQRSVLTAFRDEVEDHNGVTDVIRTGYSFTRSYDTFGWIAADGTPFETHNLGVDFGYLDALGMQLAAGRDFSPAFPSDSTQSVLVNEAFVRTYGLDDPIGYVLTGLEDSFFGANPTIIGVVKDFNFQSLHDEVEPAMLNMHPDYYLGMNHMLVKVGGEDLPAALASMEQTWARVFPDRTFSYSFLDDDMAAQYEAERRWRSIFTYASGLAGLVACLGLFGLATLVVARRTKEIGVRKVLGASASGVALLVVKDFVLLVGLATVLAWPLAFAGMHRWLADFAYRIEMPWWVFLAAGAAALLLALVTVSYHALRAATSDPVKALRIE